MLDVKKLLARMLKCDYVIEENSHIGANGEIRYKKWAHGMLEISIYLYGFGLSHYAVANGWYFYNYNINWNNLAPISIPNFVNTQYTVTQSWVIGSGVASPGTILNKATNQFTSFGMSNVSGKQTVQISVELKGRWK